jgi:alpha-galactosidase
MCEWGFEKPHEWAGEFANSWRTTGDISDNWFSFTHILEKQVGLEKYAGPGGWNDPDMLEVGNGGMSTVEYQAHFALWSLLKAPLLIGCDITKMSEDTKRILFNEEVIAVNQVCNQPILKGHSWKARLQS